MTYSVGGLETRNLAPEDARLRTVLLGVHVGVLTQDALAVQSRDATRGRILGDPEPLVQPRQAEHHTTGAGSPEDVDLGQPGDRVDLHVGTLGIVVADLAGGG